MNAEILTDEEISRLDDKQIDRYKDWVLESDEYSCSCHINPPCNVCTHEGHPEALRAELEEQ